MEKSNFIELKTQLEDTYKMIELIKAHNEKYSTGFDFSSWEDEAEYIDNLLGRIMEGKA